jgi:hypothetical protein
MYSWAVANGVASILAILDQEIVNRFLCLAATGWGPPGKARIDDAEAYNTLLTVLENRILSQNTHAGFWNGLFVYSAASRSSYFFKSSL